MSAQTEWISIEQYLGFVEEKARIGFWTWDFATKVVTWSSGVYRLLGFQPGAVQASFDLFVSLMHPEDRSSRAELDDVVRKGMPVDRRIRIIRPDGRLQWLASKGEVLLDRKGTPVRAIGVLVDINPLQEALHALSRCEDRFRMLTGTVGAISWNTDRDGWTTDSPDWRAITGQTVEEFRGWGWLQAVHPADRHHTMAAWARAVAERTAYRVEYRLRHADGNYHWYRTHASPVFNRDGTVQEWVGICLRAQDTPRGVDAGPDPAQPLTGAQIRAARGILNWSVRDLSEAAAVSAAIIRRLESVDGALDPDEEKSSAIRRALEEAGIEFIFGPSGRPGVRPR